MTKTRKDKRGLAARQSDSESDSDEPGTPPPTTRNRASKAIQDLSQVIDDTLHVHSPTKKSKQSDGGTSLQMAAEEEHDRRLTRSKANRRLALGDEARRECPPGRVRNVVDELEQLTESDA